MQQQPQPPSQQSVQSSGMSAGGPGGQPIPPTLPSLQHELGSQSGMPGHSYPYSSLSGGPLPSTPFGHSHNPLPAVDSGPLPHMRSSHHGGPPEVVSPQGNSNLGPMQLAAITGHQLPPDLTSAESHVLGASQSYRPLNVKDALSYLDQVKIRFSDQPEVYNRFLDIMKDFKSQSLDTPGVIDRVSTLFREHPELISGFNTFLPPGYKIEPGPNGDVKVTTPRDAPPYHPSGAGGLVSLGEGASSVSNGTMVTGGGSSMPSYFNSSSGGYGSSPMSNLPMSQLAQHATAPSAQQGYSAAIASASNIISSMQSHGSSALQQPPSKNGDSGANRRAPVEFNHAINYVNKIKNRFSTEPETYKQFLEILQTYQKEQKPIQEVYAQVQVLFKGAPDLLDEFKQFLPDNSNQGQNGLAAFGRGGGIPVLGTMANGMAVPQVQQPGNQRANSQSVGGSLPAGKHNKHKRPASSSVNASSANGPYTGNTVSSAAQIPIPPPKKKAKMTRNEKPGTLEELEFFDKCKKVINNKTTYNEFLKILNLFSQEIIEAKVLVERVEPFLSKAPDLFEWFKRFVKYEDDEVIYNIPAERPEINVNTLRRLGHSYRQLPLEIPRPKCTGRDALCTEVLNDEWISHPVYVSETGFVSHKKTQFEEALHKCEEERYEFDMNIEANLHTIQLLEPIAKRIQGMTADERNRLRFPEGLGGTSKTIYQRVIKKVYDKERGMEIIDALHNNPSVAVPVVLKRLKQKDEEWKRAQREWNKVWREIDSKNYYKALDHQGIHFKTTDKKTMSAKSLLAEVETIAREQREKRSNLPNRYQFDFIFKDQKLFEDVRQLLRMQVEMSVSLNDPESRKIRRFLRFFVDQFFELTPSPIDPEELESEDEDDDVDVDTEDDATILRNGKARAAANLRRNVLTKHRSRSRVSHGLNESAASATNEESDEDADIDSIGGSEAMGGVQTTGGDYDSGADFMDMDMIPAMMPLPRRSTYVFYANNAFYVFMRLFQMLYARLSRMKEFSTLLSENPPRADRRSSTAKELGLQKNSIYDKCDRYQELLVAIGAFIQNDMDAFDFEDKCRAMYGTSAYLIFTVDKLCQAVVKQLHSMVSDPKTMELANLFYKDRAKASTNARQDAMYRLNAESLLSDENVFRLEYFLGEKVLTFQLLGKDDLGSEGSVSHEDKWSLYVDHFVQLDSNELYRREPFLRRTLPKSIPDRPPTDVETRSGLEMKICVNTYKVFFVDHTEDYFSRRRNQAGQLRVEEDIPDFGLFGDRLREANERLRRERRTKFYDWLEGPHGWKQGLEKVPGTDGDASLSDDEPNPPRSEQKAVPQPPVPEVAPAEATPPPATVVAAPQAMVEEPPQIAAAEPAAALPPAAPQQTILLAPPQPPPTIDEGPKREFPDPTEWDKSKI